MFGNLILVEPYPGAICAFCFPKTLSPETLSNVLFNLECIVIPCHVLKCTANTWRTVSSHSTNVASSDSLFCQSCSIFVKFYQSFGKWISQFSQDRSVLRLVFGLGIERFDSELVFGCLVDFDYPETVMVLWTLVLDNLWLLASSFPGLKTWSDLYEFYIIRLVLIFERRQTVIHH